jgi:hypothetical protein
MKVEPRENHYYFVGLISQNVLLKKAYGCIYVINAYHFNVHGSVHRNNILIHIQQSATSHSLFYMETALHVSGGIITHHQECKQLYLQHLVFVTPLLLSAVIVEELELV